MVKHADIDHTGITGAGGAITVEEEGTPLATAATTLDFVGGGVTASGAGAEKTITIPAASATKLDDLAAPDDNTDLNASTSAHGLLKKLSNVSTEYMDGTGNWSTPAGGGGGGGTYTIAAIATGTATEVTPTGTVVWADGVDGLNGRAILSASFRSIAANDVSAQLIPIGSATQIETAFRISGNNQNYAMAGPCFTDGTATTSEILWGNYTFGPGISAGALYIYRGGTITAYGAAFTEYTPGLATNSNRALNFLRLTLVSANTWRLEYSIDGALWSTFGISDVAETMTPTHMGVAISNEGGAGYKFVTFEYFKHNG